MAGLIVHEWIERHGGSEKVLDAMVDAFPDADIHCLWNNAPERYANRKVIESWLSKTSLRRSKALALPLMPATWARTSVYDRDFVLVSSHLFAHHIGGKARAGGPSKHVYVHSPARYLWNPELDSRGNNIGARSLAPILKRIDSKRAGEGSIFAANSQYVRKRIQNSWKQDAQVIYPPVDVEVIQSQLSWRDVLSSEDDSRMAVLPSQYILAASRFIPYKKLEVAIRAGEATGIPVVIAGSGPQLRELVERASSSAVPVHIVEQPSDKLLYSLYQNALVFIFPPTEDFGIMPVEAMAAGTPAIVSWEGGARESVEEVAGGTILQSYSSDSLKSAVDKAVSIDMSATGGALADKFGKSSFQNNLQRWILSNNTSRNI